MASSSPTPGEDEPGTAPMTLAGLQRWGDTLPAAARGGGGGGGAGEVLDPLAAPSRFPCRADVNAKLVLRCAREA